MNKSQLITYLVQTDLFFYSYKAADEVLSHHFQRCLGFGLVFPPCLLARCYWEAGWARWLAGPRVCVPARRHSAELRTNLGAVSQEDRGATWAGSGGCSAQAVELTSLPSEQTFPVDDDSGHWRGEPPAFPFASPSPSAEWQMDGWTNILCRVFCSIRYWYYYSSNVIRHLWPYIF